MPDDYDIHRFEILPLLDDIKINDKIPVKINCIDFNKDDIYIGGDDSFILYYCDLLKFTGNNSSNVFYKYLSLKKPITNIKTLPTINRLICICDNSLILLTLNNLELIENFRIIRNLNAICLNYNPILNNNNNNNNDNDGTKVEICLAKFKQLTISMLYSDRIVTKKEINIPEQAIMITMDGHYVCMAGATNYYMINYETNSIQTLCGRDSLSNAICRHITENEFLINGSSHLGIFVNTLGWSDKPPIDWGENIQSIAYLHPYVICLKNNSISIISVIDQKTKDEFVLDNGVLIENYQNNIIVSTTKSIFLMKPIAWNEQIDSLLLNGKCGEAIDFYKNLQQNEMIKQSEDGLDYLELIFIRAGLNELKNENFPMAKQYLFESHCQFELLICLNDKIKEILNIPNENINHLFNNNVQALFKLIKDTLNSTLINEFLLYYIKETIYQLNDNRNVNLVKTVQLLCLLEDRSKYLMSIEQFFNENDENSYDWPLIETYLIKHKYHYHLALFYRSRNKLNESIDLLKNLEKNIIQDDCYPGLVALIKLINNCGNSILILNNIEFILKKNPNEAVQILIQNTKLEDNRFPILNPEYVINVIHQYREALVIYLEYLIMDMKLETSQIHTALIIIYIEILALQIENEEEKSKLFMETKIKLQRILKESNHYDRKNVLNCLTKNGFDYEKAFLLGKMGEHRKALQIYLEQYLDYEQALKHCIHYGFKNNNNNDNNNDNDNYDSGIFHLLLTMYLDLFKKNGPEVLKPLLEYLNHSECQFDLLCTLNELPIEWPLNLLQRHLSNQVTKVLGTKFQTSLGRVLALSLLKRIKIEKQSLINKSIRIDRDSVCCICQTKLLDSKFVWIPLTENIVHDFCYYGSITDTNDNNDNAVVGQ